MFKLALKRLIHHKLTTAITFFTVLLSTFIFLLLNNSLKNYSERLTERAQGPILVAGPKYSGIDLVLKSLYFRSTETPNIQYKFTDIFSDSANVVPMFINYRAQGFSICGTSPEYFKVRSLEASQGLFFSKLGQCTIGSNVASALSLKVGDSLVSDPENILNPAGSMPLKMTITGILQASGSPDDNAVFCSLKTAWTIHGLGHAHPESTEKPDYGAPFLEITAESLKTFHFHGTQSEFPLTALLLIPESDKNRAMLLAQAATSKEIAIIKPKEGLTGLINMIFHLDSLFFFALCLTIFVIATLFTFTLYLSIKLRINEKLMFDRLGVESQYFARLVSLEWSIVFTLGISSGVSIFVILTPFINNLLDFVIRN